MTFERLLVALGLLCTLGLSACTGGKELRFENRTGTLMTVRIEARDGRSMRIELDEAPNAAELGQQRFADRPAGGLRGLSPDGSSFGPMRINPGETVVFRIQDPKGVTPGTIKPGDEALWFQVSPILSRRETVIEHVLYEPIPPRLVLVETTSGYRFEVPADFAPAFDPPKSASPKRY